QFASDAETPADESAAVKPRIYSKLARTQKRGRVITLLLIPQVSFGTKRFSSVYHILRFALQKRAQVFHSSLHQALTRCAGGPGEMRSDDAVPGAYQNMVRRRRFA